MASRCLMRPAPLSVELGVFFRRVRRICAVSCDSMRAEPNMTIVSPIPSFLSCTKGCRYSARMRMGRAAVLSRNRGSWCGALGACWGLSLTCPGDMRTLRKTNLHYQELRGVAATSEGAGASNWIHWARRPAMMKPPFLFALLAVLTSAALFHGDSVPAQAPTGPITPQAGTPVQQPPPQSKIVTRVSLVNTPATVKDANGQMVNTLDAKEFHITDDGV